MLFYCYKYTFLILCNEAKGASAKTLRFYWGFYWVQTQIFAGFSVLGTSSRTGSRVRSVFTLNVTGGAIGWSLRTAYLPPASSCWLCCLNTGLLGPPAPRPSPAACSLRGGWFRERNSGRFWTLFRSLTRFRAWLPGMTEAGLSAGGGGVWDCDRAPPTQRDYML